MQGPEHTGQHFVLQQTCEHSKRAYSSRGDSSTAWDLNPKAV
jgi:hypothetical protein